MLPRDGSDVRPRLKHAASTFSETPARGGIARPGAQGDTAKPKGESAQAGKRHTFSDSMRQASFQAIAPCKIDGPLCALAAAEGRSRQPNESEHRSVQAAPEKCLADAEDAPAKPGNRYHPCFALR